MRCLVGLVTQAQLSQARHVDIRTGAWPIEGFGIRPDQPSVQDTREQLERYFKFLATGGDPSKDKRFRAKVLREALAFNSFR